MGNHIYMQKKNTHILLANDITQYLSQENVFKIIIQFCPLIFNVFSGPHLRIFLSHFQKSKMFTEN